MKTEEQIQEEVARTRIPKQGEILGRAIQMLGANKIRVQSEDGLTRVCRIPGKMKKSIWIRLGDLVLIEPWSVQPKERADIIWKYTRTQASWMERKGYLKNLRID